MHRLSAFQGLAGICVLRDGTFALTGKLSTPLDGLCVPLRAARYLEEVNANSRVAAVLTTSELAEGVDPRFALAITDNPDIAHSEIHARLAVIKEAELRARPNRIDNTAIIDAAAHIAGYGVEIGPRVRIGPNAFVAPGVSIEENCVLHAGVNLGTPSFNTGIIGGRQRIIPQVGGVRLKPFVELLANSCVARALFGGETTIGEETVADSLVSIAHDVMIGRRVAICAQANILGRVAIGDDAYIGPSSVIANGTIVGERAKISIGSVVTQNVASEAVVSGNFAISHDRFLAHLRSIR